MGFAPSRCRSRSPLLACAARGREARPQGGRPVRGGWPRRDQGGVGHGDQSGRQPAQRRRRARGAAWCELCDRVGSDSRHRHRRRLPHSPARARLGGEGRHRTSSERGISRQRPFLPPPGEARQDWWILGQVAQPPRLRRRPSPGRGVADIFREHAALSAFENDGVARFRHRRVPRSTMLPTALCRDLLSGAATALLRRWRFSSTPTVRALRGDRERVHPVHAPTIERPLRLNTGRVRDQWRTMTRTGKVGAARRPRPEPAVEMHPRGGSCGAVLPPRRHRTDLTKRAGAVRAAGRSSDSVRLGELLCAGAVDSAGLARRPHQRRRQSGGRSNFGQPELKHAIEITARPCGGMARFSLVVEYMLPQISYWTPDHCRGHHASARCRRRSRSRRRVAPCRRRCAPPIRARGSAAMRV